MQPDTVKTLIALNQKLLDAIAEGDWATYTGLCDPTLTAIEPEALGHVIAGMEFHQFYFDRASGGVKPATQFAIPMCASWVTQPSWHFSV